MVEKGLQRKLRAIFSADVKGYSKLMGDDDEYTVNTLKDFGGERHAYDLRAVFVVAVRFQIVTRLWQVAVTTLNDTQKQKEIKPQRNDKLWTDQKI